MVEKADAGYRSAPEIGYEQAAAIAKEAAAGSVKQPFGDVARRRTDLRRRDLDRLLRPESGREPGNGSQEPAG